MRYWFGSFAVSLVLGVGVVGCGPNVPQSELGTIVTEIPSVAGNDEPYKLPDLPPLPPGDPRRSRSMPSMMPPMMGHGETHSGK